MNDNVEDLPLLIAQTGPLNGQNWLIKDSILVGRDATCTIVVADRQVSRKHACFNSTPDGITIEDLGSKNGTHLNGQRIKERALLQDGDIVQIALAQQFVYLSSDSTVPLESKDLADMPYQQGRMRLDKRSRRVWVMDEEVIPPLSVAQFAMLEILYRRRGRVVSRQELVEEIWGEEHAFDVSNQALDALVRRLRDRLAAVDDSQSFIITVRGHGLRLDNPKD
jgi:pSer/pThr/pTyr-binding forkhead associated (FHA) protein